MSLDFSIETPFVTLVTPTYNQGRTIRQTIESVLSQSYPHFEYWVIDGASTDDTLQILSDYRSDPRLHVISEPDRGQSDALEKGLKRSHGLLWNWINSDDYLLPDALLSLHETYQRFPEARIFSGITEEFEEGQPEKLNPIRLQLRSDPSHSIAVGVFCQPSTFWKTETVRALGGIHPALHYVMDWHLWVRYLCEYGHEGIALIPQALARFRKHPQSKSISQGSGFHAEAATIYRALLERARAPETFYSELPSAFSKESIFPSALTFRCFSAKSFLKAYADKKIRIFHKRGDHRAALHWLWISLRKAGGLTLWRLKILIRSLWRKLFS
ncbi:MAG: glycosyltransferase [Methylacidiphilales bacterium]|nr:glycosyltransferase [Candidatus Methylacidiphilales bacterium]MDW8348919.1 glycosyltransferase family 2 protein [Verrucomicrobiae bacterium]